MQKAKNRCLLPVSYTHLDVYKRQADIIAEQQLAASAASYQEVCPEAETFEHDDTLSAAVDALGGEVYGTSYGNVYINDVVVGKDASGNTAGYVFSVTSSDGYAGNITISVGISADGTVNGISFTELNETAGIDVYKRQELSIPDFSRKRFRRIRSLPSIRSRLCRNWFVMVPVMWTAI